MPPFYKTLTAVAGALTIGLLPVPVSANCPTLAMNATGKYAKVYVQDPYNIGNSWRLYVRPRNGACLSTPGYFKSPTNTKGQSNGSNKSQPFEPGSKNCEDDYKSYMPVDVPSTQAIYDTYVTYKSATYIGFKIPTTKNSGYTGVIAIIPMTKADGTPDNANAQVIGVCYQ